MPTTPHNLIVRLSRIEGQVAALKRSLETDAAIDCAQTLFQVKAATNGLKRFAEEFSRERARQCIREKTSRNGLARDLDTIINSAFSLS